MSLPDYLLEIDTELVDNPPFGLQYGLDGKPHIPAGQKPLAQVETVLRWLLDEFEEDYPEVRDDEDLLAAVWLSEYKGYRSRVSLQDLYAIARKIRKADVPRLRRFLRQRLPYTEAEEERRQAKARSRPDWT